MVVWCVVGSVVLARPARRSTKATPSRWYGASCSSSAHGTASSSRLVAAESAEGALPPSVAAASAARGTCSRLSPCQLLAAALSSRSTGSYCARPKSHERPLPGASPLPPLPSGGRPAVACNASTFCAALACGRDRVAVKLVSEVSESVSVTGRTGSRSSPLVSAELLALCPKEAGSRRGGGRAAATARGGRTGSGDVSSVMSMTTGALPVGPLEEDGWGAAGWKANLVRSMVGAEVPLDEVGAEVPLDEVGAEVPLDKEAGRRRFIRGPALPAANTARYEEEKRDMSIPRPAHPHATSPAG